MGPEAIGRWQYMTFTKEVLPNSGTNRRNGGYSSWTMEVKITNAIYQDTNLNITHDQEISDMYSIMEYDFDGKQPSWKTIIFQAMKRLNIHSKQLSLF